MSLYEFLITKGFNKIAASAICVKLETDIPLTKYQEYYYKQWLEKISKD